MRPLFFLVFICCTAAARAQLTTIVKWQNSKFSSRSDTIYYDPARKLNWNDFRGNPDMRSEAAAITAAGFGYNMTLSTVDDKGELVIVVNCYFSKPKSWVKRQFANDYALNHEQQHFDITYIAARRFVDRLRKANFTISNYLALVDKLHDESYADLQQMQNAYDGETSNGRLEKVQEKWNQRVMGQLAALAIN